MLRIYIHLVHWCQFLLWMKYAKIYINYRWWYPTNWNKYTIHSLKKLWWRIFFKFVNTSNFLWVTISFLSNHNHTKALCVPIPQFELCFFCSVRVHCLIFHLHSWKAVPPGPCGVWPADDTECICCVPPVRHKSNFNKYIKASHFYPYIQVPVINQLFFIFYPLYVFARISNFFPLKD